MKRRELLKILQANGWYFKGTGQIMIFILMV